MWDFKYFKTIKSMQEWIDKNKHRYEVDIIIVNNGYGLEYRPLKIIDIQ